MLRQLAKRTHVYRGLRKAIVIRDHRLYRKPRTALAYLLQDPEIDNFTYDILNRDELTAFVARVTGIRAPAAQAFIAEADAIHAGKPLGRRLGWYALVRALQPELVYETGTHLGLGSLTLAEALRRNGHGRLITFDIAPGVGQMIHSDLPVEIVIGDTRKTLSETLERVGRPELFLHDSAHTYEHEAAEYEAVYEPGMWLISDNAHATTVLADFAASHDLAFAFFRERPRNHWYPGAGIGVAH
jgi:Methyltransferase domain